MFWHRFDGHTSLQTPSSAPAFAAAGTNLAYVDFMSSNPNLVTKAVKEVTFGAVHQPCSSDWRHCVVFSWPTSASRLYRWCLLGTSVPIFLRIKGAYLSRCLRPRYPFHTTTSLSAFWEECGLGPTCFSSQSSFCKLGDHSL